MMFTFIAWIICGIFVAWVWQTEEFGDIDLGDIAIAFILAPVLVIPAAIFLWLRKKGKKS